MHLLGIPNLLNSLPNLESLSLSFPDDMDGGSYVEPTPLFKETGFDIITNSTGLPRLRNLHLAHVCLNHNNAQGLQGFLFNHRKTLTKVKFMSLALSVIEWRPFIAFIAKDMNLDSFELDSDLSPEAEKINNACWSRIPKELLPRKADFQRASKSGSVVNGKKVDHKALEGIQGLIGS